MGDRVLIVEDEALLREILCDYFQAKGEEPIGAENGAAALRYLEEHTVDAMLLDILMPEIDGFSVCRAVRRESAVPIIFLTALSDEDDKLKGYELGADDYVTKPYSMAVLYAKTKALIARSRGCLGGGKLEAGDISLGLGDHTAVIHGASQVLPNREYQLLRCFLENKNQVMTREQLLRKVWGYDYEGDERTVDTHVKKLRARGVKIETVIRVGYRFREESQ
jgi:DNA-binding response OmpR family regulator